MNKSYPLSAYISVIIHTITNWMNAQLFNDTSPYKSNSHGALYCRVSEQDT